MATLLARHLRRRRNTTLLAVLGGAAMAQGSTPAHAIAPPDVPLAECHNMSLGFTHLTPHAYDVVVTATVTKSGLFQLGDGHGYFGSSTTPPDPSGQVMTSTAEIIGVAPGSSMFWDASCVGGEAEATVHVPALPQVPTVHVHGPTVLRPSTPRLPRDPLTATAVAPDGTALAAHCAPAVLPITSGQTVVTCTSAPDARGQVGVARRTVTVLGAAGQLRELRNSFGPSRLRTLLGDAVTAIQARDAPATSTFLGLTIDELQYTKLSAEHEAVVRADVNRVAGLLGLRVPSVHEVRPGDTIWSTVRDTLRARTGHTPSEHEVKLAVRSVLLLNPHALDARGLLHPGTVLRLPI